MRASGLRNHPGDLTGGEAAERGRDEAQYEVTNSVKSPGVGGDAARHDALVGTMGVHPCPASRWRSGASRRRGRRCPPMVNSRGVQRSVIRPRTSLRPTDQRTGAAAARHSRPNATIAADMTNMAHDVDTVFGRRPLPPDGEAGTTWRARRRRRSTGRRRRRRGSRCRRPPSSRG